MDTGLETRSTTCNRSVGVFWNFNLEIDEYALDGRQFEAIIEGMEFLRDLL